MVSLVQVDGQDATKLLTLANRTDMVMCLLLGFLAHSTSVSLAFDYRLIKSLFNTQISINKLVTRLTYFTAK